MGTCIERRAKSVRLLPFLLTGSCCSASSTELERITQHRVKSCWSTGFTWDTCCHPQYRKGGNPTCWDGKTFTHKRCCALLPGSGNEDAMPHYAEEVLFGLEDGASLSVKQSYYEYVRFRLGETSGAIYNPAWASGFLWLPGALLSRIADCASSAFWKGRRVLELGAGVGLPSAIARYYGANVTVTDVQVPAFRAIKRNLMAVKPSGAQSKVPAVRHLDTAGLRGFQGFGRHHGKFEVVMGAATFDHGTWIEDLLAGIRFVMEPCRGAVAVIVSGKLIPSELTTQWPRQTLRSVSLVAESANRSATSSQYGVLAHGHRGDNDIWAFQHVDAHRLPPCKSDMEASDALALVLDAVNCTLQQYQDSHLRWPL